MPTKEITDDEYRKGFALEESKHLSSIRAKALERALDIRKFEIELYWKRATYFWTFIAAALAGFVALRASSALQETKDDLSVMLCSLGLVFSIGWLCVNRGSKYWQENWEFHVDMLEDEIQGPLYKVVLSRRRPNGLQECISHLLTGPSRISVSKIKQLISLFISFVWPCLLIYVLPPFRSDREINWFYVSLVGLSLLTCAAFFTIGRTYSGGYWHQGTIRTATINNSPQ